MGFLIFVDLFNSLDNIVMITVMTKQNDEYQTPK